MIPNNASTLRITAAAGTELAGAFFTGTVRLRRVLTAQLSSPWTGLYNPKAFVAHAAWLRQTFVHCARFPTAASRRSLDRVSVPVWLIALSDQLPITGLVGHYPTNYLMGRELILRQEAWLPKSPPFLHSTAVVGACPVLAPLSKCYPEPSGQITHVLLTRSPLYSVASYLSRSTCMC